MVDLAIANGISRTTYYSRVRAGWTKERAATEKVRRYTGDYAVYKNGEIVVIGTRKECADELGVSEDYIQWLTTPTGMKRRSNRKNPEMATSAVKLDVDDEEEW